MVINDIVYGQEIIEDSVLIDLIESAPLKRIQHVRQDGPAARVFPELTVTRFDHCVGVMILLRRLGASIEEQIAGLLHDVPHTAFSHAADFIFPEQEEKQTFHEGFLEKIIMSSEIPEIIAQHNLDLSYILNEHNFTLLEQDIPDLCADRIDYTVRSVKTDPRSTVGDPAKYDNAFINENGFIIMNSAENAYSFARDFLQTDIELWTDPSDISTFKIMGDAMRLGMEKQIITQDDLFKTDDEVWNMLEQSGDKKISDKLNLLVPGYCAENNPNDYDFKMKTKVRYADPKFKNEKGELERVTDRFPEFKKEIDAHKQNLENGLFIKILSP